MAGFSRDCAAWATMLHAAACRHLPDMGALLRDAGAARAFVRDFADEYGHRRGVDAAFLRAILDIPGAQDIDARCSLDGVLWRAAAAHECAPWGVMESAGPLSGRRGDAQIEVWTETDLCALHALWRIARITGSASCRARALEAARWHVAETQPDNATNHPWAIHVFVVLARGSDAATERRSDEGAEAGRQDACPTTDAGGAELYAQSLLHGCQVQLARPDRLSTLILWDAARELHHG